MPMDELEKELDKPTIIENKEKEYKNKDIHNQEIKERDITKESFFPKVIEFTTRLKKIYGDMIKSVLIFGSAARGDMKEGSDIDVWVVVDDTAAKRTEDVNKIRLQIQLIATELKDIHPQMNTLTEFWNWMKIGSPELFNFLRVGFVVYDTGFIKPVQRMLQKGLLSPSEETAALKFKSSESIIKRVESVFKTMIFDLRYAATDICQAVIIYQYKEAPDQKNMPEYLKRLVKDKKLPAIYVEKFEKLNKLWKDIDHNIIKNVTIDHVKEAMDLSKSIIEEMKKHLPEDIKDYDTGFGGLF
ncbi:MAG: nucleotidyltransferase domain-containing protein [Candidatus Aenigmarchaeota archaeon]|nr:nucleotidyltransferase domain-containing protein [Candidatus Aenigmarchaeota archaeon]MBU5689462.1 nucleotidyltransferase domain-containing protein [Candidatus Aenigmarchaeota archaeon]